MTSNLLLRKEDWFVRSIPSWEARKLVQDHHYSRDFAGSLDPTMVHGLVRRTEGAFARPWGVAIWYGAVFALRRYGPVLQLSRLVCVPEAPKNAASFLLRHSMALIDRGAWPTLLTYADTGQNHTGAIYKATGWTVDGYGEGWNYYEPSTGRQLSSLQNGHFIPCPDGWEARKTRKHRFIHAVAASSDAVTIQVEEGGSQPTLPLQAPLFFEPSAVRSAVEMEATSGFEPLNRGFADSRMPAETTQTRSVTRADDDPR